jgi:hypothetical protein
LFLIYRGSYALDIPSPDQRTMTTDRPALILGRALYERLVHADPHPDDVMWDELPEAERESFAGAAIVVVRHYEALIGAPASVL